MLNSCSFTGWLTAEPVLYENENNCRAVFTLGVNSDRKGEDGQYAVDYLDFVVWNGTARFVMQWLHKGDEITVANARAQVRNYTDRDGNQRRRVEFVAEKVYFVRLRNRDANDLPCDD